MLLLILAGGRGSKLARDLPGTGSKTGRYGISGTTEVARFGAASQPIVAVVTS
ncbi:hypothetical protein ALO40_200284 [Pseudomonas syringae pv. viburni]|uniref:Membrane protein n=1 Tax=Pseudomonas syringae pv. viburni TaxID=251703 RepID=A0A0Q0CV48_9PSED|nr:hypothetical protein ALO40_200284 [Pseudomonas syringae pv. viburni]